MSDLTPKNHSFALTVVTFGTHRMQGFAEGEPISWASGGETTTGAQGADGETVINKKGERLSRLTVRLMASSASNTYLSAQYNILKQPLYQGKYPPCIVNDANTGSTHTAPRAWIVQAPSTGLGEEAGTVEWIFEGLFLQNLSGALI